MEIIKEMIQEISTEAFLHLTINDIEETQVETTTETQGETTTETHVETTAQGETTTETQVETTTETQVETTTAQGETTTETQVETVTNTSLLSKILTNTPKPNILSTDITETQVEPEAKFQENIIVSEQQVAISSLHDETETETETETDSDDDMSKMYLVLINNQTRFVVNTKSKAQEIVEEKVKDFLDYYSADNSIYRVFITIKDNTYTISGYYKFMTIQCETVFETLKIEEIEKIN